LRTWGAAALLAIAMLSAPESRAEGWTLLCTDKGRTVHLERYPGEVPAGASETALHRNPGATCITLAPTETNAPAALIARDPGMEASTGISTDPQIGLGAALRVLRGEAIGTAESVTEARPTSSDPKSMRPKSANWVRLAIYRSKDPMDALADWQRILIAEPHLAYLVPSVTQTNDGWLMLSAGPITDRIERDGLCLAAGHLDLDCIRGEEEVTNAAHEAKTAAIALAKTWPALVSSWNPPAECQLVPGIEREAEVYQPGRRQGLRCWRTPFDPPEAVVDIAALGPPLPIASMAKPSAVKVRTAKSPAPKPRPKLVAPPAVPLQIGLPPKSAAVAVRVAN